MTQVTGHNGVRMSVRTAGDPANPGIVLIHGWSQSSLSWTKQLNSALADDYFLIAPDLRGHGASDKPDAPEAYDTSRPWADDIKAVIDHFALVKPILVGWSMGGKVLLDFLRIYGDAALAGVAHVGSAISSGKYTHPEAAKLRGDAAVAAKGMYEAELETNLAATLEFVKACFGKPPSADELAMTMGFNMLCPPHVRAASRLRHEDYAPDAAACTVPALIVCGDLERIMPRILFEESCAAFPAAEPAIFEGCGHATFWEEPDKFNQTLAEFAGRAFGKAAP